MKVSVCIPMYNEKKVIAATAKSLYTYMESAFPGDYEIVFADDGSTDGSAAEVEALSLPTVRVISYQPNRGKGYAVRTALLASRGDIAFFTDAVLAYGTDVISRFVGAFEEQEGLGLCIGSRNLSKDGYEGYTFLRRVASKAYLKVLAVVGGLKLSDSQCGCKAFTHDAVQAIFPRCKVDRFAFDFEAILWAQKLKIPAGELPVKVLVHGDSKVHLVKDTFRMLRDLVRMRRRIRKAKI